MNYKFWLVKNGLEDNKENYAKYVVECEPITKHMNPELLKQYIDETYKIRFINNPK